MSVENLVGQSFGQYELRDLLGVGGMGAVYRGYQKNLERVVAIKVLSAALAGEPGYLERFYREAKMAASLEHNHIVPVYDYGTQRDLSYVVMRLLSGGTLAERIIQQANKRPSLGEAARLLDQLASALDYAHSQGVLHRDIKPSNVMFDNQGNAFLVDFGIAKLMGTASGLTGTGVTMGTPAYMPPEQWRSEELTPAADQYALGATIYALVTGRVPFEATTPFGLMHKHLNETPTPVQLVRPDFPEALNLVLERAMAKKPQDRFPTMTAFAQAFTGAVAGHMGEQTTFFTAPVLRPKARPAPAHISQTAATVIDTAPPAPPPPQRRALWWGAGALIIGVLALIGILVLTSGEDDDHSEESDAKAGLVTTATPTDKPTTPTATENIKATALVIAEGMLTSTAELFTPTVTPSPTPSLTPSPTPSLTITPSETPTPTSSPTITPSPTPSSTPSPLPTETPQPVAVANEEPIVVVTGMGIWTYAEPAGTLLDPVRNGRLPILARTADNRWLKVRLEDGSEVWVGNSNGLTIEGNLDSVPVEAGMAVVVIKGMGIWTYAEPAGTLLDPVRNGRLPILARTADNRWLKVRLDDGSEVWVGNSNGLPIEGNLDSVPVEAGMAVVVIKGMGIWTYAEPAGTLLDPVRNG
ncbi:MAG TPA: serine/threonine-protein kinase, partial [Aggregatilineaceae bacterium]|nr:serine/threonine-protein kinase [Aggregatilineaceae bacterium]